MGKVPLVLPVLGVIAASEISVDEVVRTSGAALFEHALQTPAEPFTFTDYYEEEMGKSLVRFWCAGVQLVPATLLPDYKLAGLEAEVRWRVGGARRVNLDPGYISTLQMVLATTKPLPQATYVRDGIYALVELLYRDGGFQPLPWTYPDYRKAAAGGVFEPFRAHFLRLRREMGK